MKEIKICTPIYLMNYDDGNNKFYIKRDDLIPFSFGGNKVRIAEQYFEDMKKKGCNCIISYGSIKSNLNRVIANMSKSKGIHCYVVSAIENSFEVEETNNSKLIKKLRVNVVYSNKDNVAETIYNTINDCELKGLKPYYIYGNIYGKGNEKVAVQAYYEAYDEICEYEKRLGDKFDYIFHSSGTGMTQSGLICGKLKHGDSTKIVGISIARAKEVGKEIITNNISNYFKNEKVVFSDEDICFEDKYLCGGYGEYDNDVLRIIDEILNIDGIPLDTTYTGKGFWGMLKYIKEKEIKGSRVLFIHTGGVPLFFDDLNIGREE